MVPLCYMLLCPCVYGIQQYSHANYNFHVFRKRLSTCVYSSFPSGFEGGIWNSNVIIPEHRPSIYFSWKGHTNDIAKP